MVITFSVSSSTKLLLEPNQTVDFSTAIAQSAEKEIFQFNVADELGIAPDKIFMHISKIVGDTVTTSEIIAMKKGSFSTKEILAPKDGVIKEINHETGNMLIEVVSEKSTNLQSYFVGKVKEVKGDQVSLEVASSEKYEVKDATADFGGEVAFHEEKDLISLTEDDLLNKVVFLESVTPAVEVKLDVLGAKGIVTLKDIKEKTGVNSAELVTKDKWQHIAKTKLQYCLVDKKNATMYLYSVK